MFKVPNIFARDGPRPLFFFSDPPHLLKTVRNCWWNPKRQLWVNAWSYQNVYYMYILFFEHMQYNGKSISWKHLEQLYLHDTGQGREVTGLRLIPKLKYEHIYLSSFSKMRVDLAAQVHAFSMHALAYVHCMWIPYYYRFSVRQWPMAFSKL